MVTWLLPMRLVAGFLLRCASRTKDSGLLTVKLPVASISVMAPLPALVDPPFFKRISKVPFSMSALLAIATNVPL